MGINIPSNSIITKYTAGGEYIYVSTYQDYQGYYYEYFGKKYAGEKFTIDALEIINKNSDKISSLLKTNNPALSIYGILSKVNINSSDIIPISRIESNSPFRLTLDKNYDDPYNNPPSFYYKKANDVIIKEISESTYISLQTNPLYQTTYVGLYNNKVQFLEDAEKQLPGITSFILS